MSPSPSLLHSQICLILRTPAFLYSLSRHACGSSSLSAKPCTCTPASGPPAEPADESAAKRRSSRPPPVQRVAAPALEPLRMQATGKRRLLALRLVGDPVLANALSEELNALADAHPELGESGAALLRLAGRTLVEQKAEVVRLQSTLAYVKASLAEHAKKIDAFIAAEPLQDDGEGSAAEALTMEERETLTLLQGVMLELLGSLDDPCLVEVERNPDAVLILPPDPPAAALRATLPTAPPAAPLPAAALPAAPLPAAALPAAPLPAAAPPAAAAVSPPETGPAARPAAAPRAFSIFAFKTTATTAVAAADAAMAVPLPGRAGCSTRARTEAARGFTRPCPRTATSTPTPSRASRPPRWQCPRTAKTCCSCTATSSTASPTAPLRGTQNKGTLRVFFAFLTWLQQTGLCYLGNS
jgi:hypothetical protein